MPAGGRAKRTSPCKAEPGELDAFSLAAWGRGQWDSQKEDSSEAATRRRCLGQEVTSLMAKGWTDVTQETDLSVS